MGCVTQPAWLNVLRRENPNLGLLCCQTQQPLQQQLGSRAGTPSKSGKAAVGIAALSHRSLRRPRAPVTALVFVTGDDLRKSTSLITASGRFSGRAQVMDNNSPVIPSP